MSEIKETIRPFYSELQGYLAQAPDIGNEKANTIYHKVFWEQYNGSIKELNTVTGKNYSRYELVPVHGRLGPFVETAVYRQKLGGLIAKLYGEYFSDEVAPFAGMPTTIISQSQQQNQSVQVQILLEVQSKIDEKLHRLEKGSKERTFLEKVKSSLSTIRTIGELLTLLFGLGKDSGLDISTLADLFK